MILPLQKQMHNTMVIIKLKCILNHSVATNTTFFPITNTRASSQYVFSLLYLHSINLNMYVYTREVKEVMPPYLAHKTVQIQHKDEEVLIKS